MWFIGLVLVSAPWEWQGDHAGQKSLPPTLLNIYAAFSAVSLLWLLDGFFAVMRSVGWAIYIIYLPIFAVESGLSNQARWYRVIIFKRFAFPNTFHVSLPRYDKRSRDNHDRVHR